MDRTFSSLVEQNRSRFSVNTQSSIHVGPIPQWGLPYHGTRLHTGLCRPTEAMNMYSEHRSQVVHALAVHPSLYMYALAEGETQTDQKALSHTMPGTMAKARSLGLPATHATLLPRRRTITLNLIRAASTRTCGSIAHTLLPCKDRRSLLLDGRMAVPCKAH